MEEINQSIADLEDEEISYEENNDNISLSSEEENYTEQNSNQIKNKENYWKNYFIKKYVYLPSECPQCKHKNVIIF